MKRCTWDCSSLRLAHHAETGADVGYCVNAHVLGTIPNVCLWQFTHRDGDEHAAACVMVTYGQPCRLAQSSEQLTLIGGGT